MNNPFGLFKFFKQKVFPSYLAVDIGTTSIKVADIKQGKQSPEITNYGILESSGYLARANQALQTSSLKLFDNEVVDLLKMVVAEMKTDTTEALASLPPFLAFMTVLDFPAMKPSELEKSLVFEAKQYIPQPISEVALDWLKVGDYRDDKGFDHNQILLISVPQEQIKKYQKIFKAAGLHLKALEIENLGLARIFGGVDPTPTAVVDIGSRSTSITFLEKGQLKFFTQNDFGGSSLTQAIAVSLGINPLRAEELKKERGVIGTGPNYELSTIMLPFLDAIINEVRKALYKYGGQFPKAANPERIILSGGGANLPGIEKYFEKELKLPIAITAPFAKFEYPLAVEPLIPELSPVMSVALGLALREFT
ncbi:MAG: type IV pilus assembly protein PilM [Patescibacteria group bacterium]|nr:type IV pilus assembly protein PilM [Patescibacteria group bacterium]MDE2015035.1 type IV pilus assembly protein PilM [Patescibacteria group bacterium]MDE2226463.1 type IV pilus assembly protein PilM [Patescibacteria group bacterium]